MNETSKQERPAWRLLRDNKVVRHVVARLMRCAYTDEDRIYIIDNFHPADVIGLCVEYEQPLPKQMADWLTEAAEAYHDMERAEAQAIEERILDEARLNSEAAPGINEVLPDIQG